MKKLLILTLALTLVFTLFACGEAEVVEGVEDATDGLDVNIDAAPSGCQHNWLSANCSMPKTCSLCNATEGTPTNAHPMTGDTLYVDGKGFAPNEYRNECAYCDYYSSSIDYDGFFQAYARLATYLGDFEQGSLPEISNVITAAFRYGVEKVYTEGEEPGIMYYTFKVEDLDAFTKKCLGTTYDYTGVQDLHVLYEASCNYDAANNTIVITVLPAGGGGGYEIQEQTLTTEDNVNFTFTAILVNEEGAAKNFSITVKLEEGNYIITSISTSSDEPVCSHEWLEATCAAPKTCSLCQATEGEKLEEHKTTKQLQASGDGFAPDQYLLTCPCGENNTTEYDYDTFFEEYTQLAIKLGGFEQGALPEISNVITAAFRFGVEKVYTQGEGEESYAMYYTFKVEDLNAFTTKCLGTTYDYTGVQDLPVLAEATCNYDAANNTVVIRALPAGGGGGYEITNSNFTTEDNTSFSVTAELVNEDGYPRDISYVVKEENGNYIFQEITF